MNNAKHQHNKSLLDCFFFVRENHFLGFICILHCSITGKCLQVQTSYFIRDLFLKTRQFNSCFKHFRIFPLYSVLNTGV